MHSAFSQTKARWYYYTGSLFIALCMILLLTITTGEGMGHLAFYPYFVGAVIIASFTTSAILTSRYLRKGKHRTLEYITLSILRYGVAITMLGYAYTKFHHGHMYISYSALDKRLNDISDFDTVWSFYGRYSLFEAIIGLLELVPAILLLFRRTMFLGAVLMLPVISNVVLINSFYFVGLFTLVVSGLVLLFTLYILYSYKAEIWNFVGQVSRNTFAGVSNSRSTRRLIAVAKFLPLSLFFISMLFRVIAGKSHHPVKGGYELVSLRKDGQLIGLSTGFEKIYFEKRAIQSSVINNGEDHGASITFYAKDSLKIALRDGPLDMQVAEDTIGMFKGVYILPSS